MIIVEGPDGAGKTSLIVKLHEYWDMPVAQKVVDKDTVPMANIRQWTDDNLRDDPDMIFDRHRLISEPIYGTAMPGNRDQGFWDSYWLTQAMDKFIDLQPLIIWCMPALDRVRYNCEVDDDNRVVRPYIDQIYRGYQAEIARWAGIGNPFQLHHDYTVPWARAWWDYADTIYRLWRDR